MSEVFKVKGLQVSVNAVCTRIGSCAAKGREGVQPDGRRVHVDTWARGYRFGWRGGISSMGNRRPEVRWGICPQHLFRFPVSLCDGWVRSPTSIDIPGESG